MKSMSDLLRQADPLNEDSRHLDQARDRIRRTVVAAASVPQPVSETRMPPPRRVAVGAAFGVLAALAVFGLLVGFDDRGTLQAAVRFEVRLAEAQPVPGLIVGRVVGSGHTIYLHPEMIVTNDDIAQSWLLEDGPDRFSIHVELLAAGAERMRHATAAHIGRPIAILIDGKVVAAPVVRDTVSNSAVITGDFTRNEAERITDGIAIR